MARSASSIMVNVKVCQKGGVGNRNSLRARCRGVAMLKRLVCNCHARALLDLTYLAADDGEPVLEPWKRPSPFSVCSTQFHYSSRWSHVTLTQFYTMSATKAHSSSPGSTSWPAPESASESASESTSESNVWYVFPEVLVHQHHPPNLVPGYNRSCVRGHGGPGGSDGPALRVVHRYSARVAGHAWQLSLSGGSSGSSGSSALPAGTCKYERTSEWNGWERGPLRVDNGRGCHPTAMASRAQKPPTPASSPL